MSEAHRDLEVVRVAPLNGMKEELLALRPQMIGEYRALFGDRFSATLSEAEDGEWVDVWSWVDRADAEHALAHPELVPSFVEWGRRVELRSLTWAKILA